MEDRNGQKTWVGTEQTDQGPRGVTVTVPSASPHQAAKNNPGIRIDGELLSEKDA